MQRTFDAADQNEFARVSGDSNPVHVDPVAARRTLFGGPIVHGIHALLWALEEVLGSAEPRARPTHLRAQFKAPIRVGEPVAVNVTALAPERLRAEVEVAGRVAVRVRIDWGSDTSERDVPAIPEAMPPPTTPRDLGLAQIEGASGRLPLQLPPEARILFPVVETRLGAHRLSALLASTRLVGMECPGLHSIYSEIAADLGTDHGGDERDPELRWSTLQADARVSRVRLQATAPGFDARITAFLRPAPQRQAAFASIRSDVPSGTFAAQQALVIGGSRGLGEVTAKLLAAGGARVVLTYQRGREDATRVVEDVRVGGGVAEAVPFDVLAQGLPRMPEGFVPTHLYYMATPPILASEDARFDPDRYEALARFYVAGFRSLVEAIRDAHADSLQGILYPSSVYVEQRPETFAEYAAAKEAGEAVCDALAQAHGLRIARPRLPRMATDQTASLTSTPGLDPASILLQPLLELARSTDPT